MRLLFFLFFLCPLLTISQINVSIEKVFGDSILNESAYLIENTKQNYFLAGNFEREPGFDNSDSDIWVQMLDSTGNIISTDTIGTEFSDNVKAISKLSNGDIILGIDYAVGATPNNFRHILIVRYDTLGIKIWEREVFSFGNSPAILNDMDIDSDDNIYLLAPNPGFRWPKIIKLNSDGIIIWEKNYPDSSREIYFNKMAISNSNFLYFMGGANSNNHDNFHLFKLDNSGEILKADTISLIPHNYSKTIQDFIIGEDNSIYFTVGNESINKIDPLGRILYQKKFPLRTSGSHSILGLNLTAHNNLIVNGNLSDPESEYYCDDEKRTQGWILELETSGAIKWTHTFGGSNNDRITHLTIVDSSSIAFAGNFRKERGSDTDAWFSLLNIDSIRLSRFSLSGPSKACIREQTLIEKPSLNYDFDWSWDNPNLISNIDTTSDNNILISWKEKGFITICASSNEINCLVNESCIQIEVGGLTSSTIDTTICDGNLISVGDSILQSAGFHEIITQNSFGCDSLIEVYINLLPNEDPPTDSEQICFGDSLEWQGHFLTQEGFYSDTLTTLNGCDSILSLNLSFFDNPQLVDTVIINDDGTNSGGITLNFADTTGYSFLWNTGDTTSAISNLEPGLYTLLLNYESNCQQIFTFHVDGVSSTNENRFSELKIYPNPATDQLTIELNEIQLEWLRIVDITGREIIRNISLSGTSKIDIRQLNPGVYFLEGKGKEGERHLSKLLKI